MLESDLEVGALYFQRWPGCRLRLVQYAGREHGALKFSVPETTGFEAGSAYHYALSFADADLVRPVSVHEVHAVLRAFRKE